MTNQERAVNLIASIAEGSLIPAERIQEVRDMLIEAELRGHRRGYETGRKDGLAEAASFIEASDAYHHGLAEPVRALSVSVCNEGEKK